MDWTQLRALVAVAPHGSFSDAAAELQLTQPGVSRQVQKVERELGVPLFIRGRDGVILTAAGTQVCAYAMTMRPSRRCSILIGEGTARTVLRAAQLAEQENA